MMERIFVHVKYSGGLPIAQWFNSEGVKPIVFIQDDKFKRMYDGMRVEKIDSMDKWLSMMRPDDYVFFDFTGNGALGDSLRKRGNKVFGGQTIADQLEHDRFFGMDVMKRYGIDIPATHYFKTRAEGVAFIKKNGGRWVYKPRKEAMSLESHVAEDESDMIDWLKSEKEQDYLLQEFVEGIEFATAVYFAQGNPLKPAYHTLETKAFMAGDVGPNVGAQSAITYFTKDLNNQAVKLGIGRLFPFFKQVKYTGTVDLNTVVTEEDGKVKMYALEFTPRIGYGCEYGLKSLINESYSELVKFCADGIENGVIDCDHKSYGFDVCVATPPYPLDSNKKTQEAVDFLFKESAGSEIKVRSNDYDVNLVSVMRRDNKLVTGGGDGLVMEVCGKTKDLKSEQDKVVAFIKDEVRITKGKLFRVDWAEKAMKHLPLLRQMGFETLE